MATEQTQARTRMHPTAHGLDESVRRPLVVLLNQRLADAADLYSQTKHAHWNVKGMDFYQLHQLFDELAELVEEHVDTIAERATALGGTAFGTVRMTAQASGLADLPADAKTGRDFLEALVDRYAQHSRKLTEAIDTATEAGDAATADVFTAVVRDVDKALYFLESHLQAANTR